MGSQNESTVSVAERGQQVSLIQSQHSSLVSAPWSRLSTPSRIRSHRACRSIGSCLRQSGRSARLGEADGKSE